MTKVIIGIHGLSSKPAPNVLSDYWVRAMNEGLQHQQYNSEVKPSEFDLAYWAVEQDDSQYQVATSIQRYERSRISDAFYRFSGTLANSWDSLTWPVMNAIIDRSAWLKDLKRYYDNPERERNILREILLQHKDKEILLIAHSMGTIIAYDVLHELVGKGVKVKFITIGSPLGLSDVKVNILHFYNSLEIPSSITSWQNFADRKDLVAVDSHLADEFYSDRLEIEDIRVKNDYPDNHHAAFGYLRTPEVSDAIHTFLSENANNKSKL